MKIKNKVLIIGIVLGVCLCVFSNSVFAVTGTVTGEHVRIRKSASSSSIEVSLATKGEKVDVIGEEGNWYKVTFEGVTGYISKDYVDTTYSASSATTEETTTSNEVESNEEPIAEQTEEPIAEPETSTAETEQTETPVENNSQENEQQTGIYIGATATAKSEISLRYLPNYASRTSSTISSGSTITIKDEIGNWVKITDENVAGWIAKSEVSGNFPVASDSSSETTDNSEHNETSTETSQDTTTNQETEPVSTTPVKTGKVNTESVRIRTKPNGAVIDTADKGTKVEILGEEDGWYEVNVGTHKNCYIAKRLITED